MPTFSNIDELFHRLKSPIPNYVLVVQGRFHAFALAKALLALELPVTVVTNYPVFIAERFGLPRDNIRGCAPLGLLHRYAHRWQLAERWDGLNRLLHVGFSKWASRQLPALQPDILHCFSGVALEMLRALPGQGLNPATLLARGSAHIREQYHDLTKESVRAQAHIERPSSWMIQREMQEYKESEYIVTLSSYARESFLRRGYQQEKLLQLSLGSNVKQFRPAREVIEARVQRYRSGAPLQVLYTGNVSLQKGVIDLIDVARRLQGVAKVRVVGNVTQDAAARVAEAGGLIEFLPRVPEHELPGIYAAADVYVFPTLHDGFAAVLAQAQAGCLPIIATDHCAAPDLVEHGVDGWVVPTRRADLIESHVRELDADREKGVRMIESLWMANRSRDWEQVARDFVVMAGNCWAQHCRQNG